MLCFVFKKEKKFYIYVYCLMGNHAHHLINEGEGKISRIMKRIGTSYAYYFNKKYDRVGHLFQDRLKSKAIEDEGYLLAAVRYIHNNPVKAGIVQKASSYQWSSYNGYIEERKHRKFLAKDMVLDISKDRKKTIELFKEYIELNNMDEFLDLVEVDAEKTIISHRDASAFAQDFLNDKGIGLSRLSEKEYVGAQNELILGLELVQTIYTGDCRTIETKPRYSVKD